MKVVWSARALRDLDELAVYIASDSMKSAERVEARIHREAVLLSEFPQGGRAGRVPGTRERIVGRTPCILVYRADSIQVRIVRILRGARKWLRNFT